MSWLHPVKPPEEYNPAWFRTYMEQIRTSINHLDETNVPGQWSSDTIASLDAIKITALTGKISSAVIEDLIVGTNVQIGSAQDEAGVTSIIGGVVTTEYLDAKNITAASVAAENITGTTITGKTLRTAVSGERIVLNASTNQLEFYGASSMNGYIHSSGANVTFSAYGSLSLYAETGYINLTSPARYYDNNGGSEEIATRGWVAANYDELPDYTGYVDMDTTSTDSNTASHNHGIASGEYLYIYNSSGDYVKRIEFVPFAGDSHSHTISGGNHRHTV